MYSAFQLAFKYFNYYIKSANGKGHGVHSPFVFDFIINVLNDKGRYNAYAPIEAFRRKLQADHTVLTIEDFGAGSRTGATKQRSVSSIAKSALKPAKFGQLLYRIVGYYRPQHIVELGTSLGITSTYLATAYPAAKLTTMEGAKAVAATARKNFEQLQLQNVTLVEGNFDDTLPPTLQSIQKVDLAYIDGNHRLEPTWQYFEQLMPYVHEQSILIFDDIHWSEEMEQAWERIKADERVLLTIDLFFIGLVFFRSDFKVKQHFSIRF